MTKTSQPLVSLCIPTNGISQWMFPVLDSIYSQGVQEDLFEVIVIDNGNNKNFKDRMTDYISGKKNLIYKESENTGFLNEIDTYRTASGKFIKFVNHRTKLVEGTLAKLVDFVQNNQDDKPVIYLSNGAIEKLEKKIYTFSNFDQFIKNLSNYSSWSTGMAFWKSDFEKLPVDIEKYNELFPHTTILFAERNKKKYIIDNSIIFDEIPIDNTLKGKYDLFYAFAVEYPSLIVNLYREGSITGDTCRCVIEDNRLFCGGLYYTFIIRKEKCSYNLDGLNVNYGIFYTKLQILQASFAVVYRQLIRRVFRFLK